MNNMNIISLLWVALGLFAAGLLIFLILKFLRKDTALISVQKYLKEGNYKKALNLCMKYQNDNPNDFLVKFYLGQAYEGLKEYNSAVQFYEKASVAAAMSAQEEIKKQIYLKVADLYRKTKKMNEALGYYVLILDKDPRNSKALLGSSEILFEGKNYKKAREYLETLVSMKGDNLRARFMLAKAYVSLNQIADAQVQLEYIMENIKARDDVLETNSALLLADVYLNLKVYQKAVSLLKSLLDNKDHYERVVLKIIDVYLKLNQIKEAQIFYNQNLPRLSQEKKCEILYLIATYFFKAKEVYKAVKIWEEAYKINPSYRDLRNVIQRYDYLIKNPKLEPLYSDSEQVFEKFVGNILQGIYFKQIIRRENFWALESADAAYIIYRRPFPIANPEIFEIRRLINQNFRAVSRIILYSLYGISQDTTSDNKSYSDEKLELIADNAFVKKVNELC